MRRALSQLFNMLPSDVFSFVAGGVFSAAVNLATAKVDPNKSLRLPLVLLAISTFGFIVLGFVLKIANDTASRRANPREAYFKDIYDRLPKLCVILAFSLGVLIIALWRLSH